MGKWEIRNGVEVTEGIKRIIWYGMAIFLSYSLNEWDQRTSFMFPSYNPKLRGMYVLTRESFFSWANLVMPVPSAEERGTMQGKISKLKLTVPCHKYPLMNTMEDCVLLIHCLSVIYIWFSTDYAAVLYEYLL